MEPSLAAVFVPLEWIMFSRQKWPTSSARMCAPEAGMPPATRGNPRNVVHGFSVHAPRSACFPQIRSPKGRLERVVPFFMRGLDGWNVIAQASNPRAPSRDTGWLPNSDGAA